MLQGNALNAKTHAERFSHSTFKLQARVELEVNLQISNYDFEVGPAENDLVELGSKKVVFGLGSVGLNFSHILFLLLYVVFAKFFAYGANVV